MPAAWEGEPARSDAAGLAIIDHNASKCVFRYKNFGFATRQRNSRSAHQLPANALHSAGCAVPGIHLANNRMNVIAGGGFSDVKGQADFTIRKTIADQTKHVVFTVRQRSHDCGGGN